MKLTIKEIAPAEATMIASKFINDDMDISGASQPSKGPHGWEQIATFDFSSYKRALLELNTNEIR